MNELDAIRARREAITPGVWEYEYNKHTEESTVYVWDGDEQTSVIIADVPAISARITSYANAAFIAAAPADVDTLLREVERLTGELAAERDAAKRHAAYIASCVDECGSYKP